MSAASSQADPVRADPLRAPDLRDRPGEGETLTGRMIEDGEKRARRRDIRPLARLLPFALKHKADLAIALFWLLASSAASLGLTATARGAIDQGFDDGGARLNLWFALLGANALFLALATAIRYFYVTKTGERVIADVRRALFGRVMTLDPSFYARIRTGEVLSRLTTDIQLVETLLTASVSFALRNLITMIGAVILLFFVNPKLTLFISVLAPATILPLF
ncbi:MAG: ABC transporter transmembrane domain-containing protein, partial [Brevundimonas sp.]